MSQNYKVSKVSIEAAFPRWTAASTLDVSDRLQISYTKFSNLSSASETISARKLNLMFLHGTGMNNAIWNYYAEKLFEISLQKNSTFTINVIIAIDAVSHGNSAILNEGKLGAEYIWIDGARDLIKIVEHEATVDSSFRDASNIVVGHSLGGHQALVASFLSPLLFDSCITIEPVLLFRKEGASGLLLALSRSIESSFSSQADFMEYMKSKSFYKKFHPRIFEDFIAHEKISKPDGSIDCKSSKELQLVVYGGCLKSVSIAWPLLKHIDIPVLHIVGSASTWNPPKADVMITKEIRNCELVKVRNGTHLLHSEQPDDCIAVIVDFLQKRGQVDSDHPKIKDRNAAFKEVYAKRFSESWIPSENAKL